MPQLRKGRIVHYVHGQSDPYPGAVEPAIIIRAYDGQAAISTFGSHGALYRDGVRVVDGPSQAVRGQAFWPDYAAEADTDFVQAASEPAEPPEPSEPSLPESGGEVPQPRVDEQDAPAAPDEPLPDIPATASSV